MSITGSKYYVEHNVTSGDVARVHGRVHLPEEFVSRFMKSKRTTKAPMKKAASKSGHSKGKRK
jgi:hypothetical protein